MVCVPCAWSLQVAVSLALANIPNGTTQDELDEVYEAHPLLADGIPSAASALRLLLRGMRLFGTDCGLAALATAAAGLAPAGLAGVGAGVGPGSGSAGGQPGAHPGQRAPVAGAGLAGGGNKGRVAVDLAAGSGVGGGADGAALSASPHHLYAAVGSGGGGATLARSAHA
ncbi:exported hypothetical protein [Thiomonas sp. X19]|nr:exported hypothetical protein [Thiomonas sp. X19]